MTGTTNAHIIQSGGMEYGFSIVKSATRPEAPANGTIWLDTADTTEGWCIAPEQPDTEQEGYVWIKQSTSSAIINAASGIRMSIRAAYILTGGEWRYVHGELYTDGAWEPLVGSDVLFIAGTSVHMNERHHNELATVSLTEEGYTLSCNDTVTNATASADIGTKDKVDLTGVDSITIRLKNVSLSNAGKIYAYLLSTRSDSAHGPAYAINQGDTPIASVNLSNVTVEELVLPVNSLSGAYYIQVIALVSNGLSYYNAAKGTASCTITEISLNRG